MLRFVEHRVGDQRLISLIRRWLKAGVFWRMEKFIRMKRGPRKEDRSAFC
jgi:hypothetical protein